MENTSQEKEIEVHEDSSGDNKNVPLDSQKNPKGTQFERGLENNFKKTPRSK
ncbi:Hypothetical protein FKW44_024120 [Caligus rogercresseyi]|uniref:Uncharacterized protein n=1 Tax=Caligus rogercresseyi TaxID=217165 RepID=A0A7T8GLU3_CALRO|nr:Hypothetical protein FKW44_024120 [Caligus rogercresseyi]